MPPTENTETIVLAIAAFLFAFALVSLVAWALKSFVLSGRSGASYETGIAGQKPLEQPVGDVMIAPSDPRAASDYSKT